MVETRAYKRAKELGRPQEESSLVVESTPTNHPSLVSPVLVIQCVEPVYSDCSGFYAKTYYQRSFKPSEGTTGKV